LSDLSWEFPQNFPNFWTNAYCSKIGISSFYIVVVIIAPCSRPTRACSLRFHIFTCFQRLLCAVRIPLLLMGYMIKWSLMGQNLGIKSAPLLSAHWKLIIAGFSNSLWFVFFSVSTVSKFYQFFVQKWFSPSFLNKNARYLSRYCCPSVILSITIVISKSHNDIVYLPQILPPCGYLCQSFPKFSSTQFHNSAQQQQSWGFTFPNVYYFDFLLATLFVIQITTNIPLNSQLCDQIYFIKIPILIFPIPPRHPLHPTNFHHYDCQILHVPTNSHSRPQTSFYAIFLFFNDILNLFLAKISFQFFQVILQNVRGTSLRP